MISIRQRPKVELTSEETTRRLMINRDWAKYKHKQQQEEMATIDRAIQSQEKALAELKLESESLYEQAIQV